MRVADSVGYIYQRMSVVPIFGIVLYPLRPWQRYHYIISIVLVTYISYYFALSGDCMTSRLMLNADDTRAVFHSLYS